MIRKILRLLLLLCAWSAVILPRALGEDAFQAPWSSGLILGCWLAVVPLGLLTGLAELLGRGEPWREGLRGALLGKLLLIPFFEANFMLGTGAAMVGLFLGFPLLVALYTAAAAWAALFATSARVIRALGGLRRAGRITGGGRVLHTLLQLIFIADLIDGLALFFGHMPARE